MKTIKAAVVLSLLFCFLSENKALGREKAALYPVQPSGAGEAAEATRYLKSAVGGGYRVLLPDEFEPVLKKEAAQKPDYPVESSYPVLSKEMGVGYVISGKAKSDSGIVSYEFAVLDITTSRTRIFSDEASVKKSRVLLRRMSQEVLRYMLSRDRLNLPSDRDSDLALTIQKRLPKRPRPPVSIAINEKVSGGPSANLVAETTLHYYLDSCGFPVKDGESLLLREYARFYFANQLRDFPLTLSAEYYIIGTASADSDAGGSDLPAAKSDLEIRLLDRTGNVVCGKKVKVEARALSSDAAIANALRVAASEIALEILPLLRY